MVMALKRIGVWFVALTLSILFIFNISVDGYDVLSIVRAYIFMPEITVEVKGSGYNASDIASTLGEEKLKVMSSEAYDQKKHSVRAYMVVDLSGSMSNIMDNVKSCIEDYVNSMGPNDHLVLITFGTSIKFVLSGGESESEIREAVSNLSINENGTLFYETLIQAYNYANAAQSSFDREYILVFSDGMDYQKGNSTYEEAISLYEARNFPLYAVCAPHASRDASDDFGRIARASGGFLTMMKGNVYDGTFDEIIASVNDVTLLKLKAGSNFVNGDDRLLSVKIGDIQANINVPVVNWIPDNVAPETNRITFDEDNNTLAVYFTKDVKNADKISAFDITETSSGKKLNIKEVKYFADRQAANLILDASYSGKFTMIFNGITDCSMEANKLIKNAYFELKLDHVANGSNSEFSWIIVLIVVGFVLLALLMIGVLLATNKKNKSENNDGNIPVLPGIGQSGNELEVNEYESNGIKKVKHHIKAPPGIRVSLRIKTGNTSEQNVSVDISSSLIVGRSDACDLYIDDTKMSRQHFAIENQNGNLALMDLNSRNGTMLNGIKINASQRLSTGDKIFAGLSDIFISFSI